MSPRPPLSPSTLFARGFRPFFLGASGLGAALILAWLGFLFFGLSLGGRSPSLWHGHEMVFGFALAVVAGFLLTAVQNWTGRETASGIALAGLFGLWLLGRLAAWIGPGSGETAARLVELSFLPVLALVLGRCILGARSWRNAGFLALLCALWLCDLAYAFGSNPSFALARAVDLVILMILIVAGRVVPMFTRNGLGHPDVTSWPRVDAATLAAAVLTFLASVADAPHPLLAILEAITSGLVLLRMIPWKSPRTLRAPLVWVLHLGHVWVAIGFALRALYHGADVGLETLGLHAFTAGAIGVMTLGMMARVALGHTGRPLVAPRGIPLAFVLVGVAALIRVVPGLVSPESYRASLLVSGLCFSAAQMLYLVAYTPMLLRPRVDGATG